MRLPRSEPSQVALDKAAEVERRWAEILKTRPALERGDRVTVHQVGVRDYVGTVGTVKYSGSTRTWWVDVELDDDGMTWGFPASDVVKGAVA